MPSDHESSERESVGADQEIPDRATADAAHWLSQKNLDFDTPTFWLVAALLAEYREDSGDAHK